MKYIALALLLMTMLYVGCKQPAVDVEAERVAVRNLIDKYVSAVETEDMDAYEKLVAHDTSMVNFGGFGKPIIGWDAL